MIYQDDTRLNARKIGKLEKGWLEKYGCAYMSLINGLTVHHKELQVSPAKLLIWLEQMIEAGCFTEDMDIIWHKATQFFGYNYSVSNKPPSTRLKKGEWAIGCWYNENTGFRHFTTLTSNGKECAYDPLHMSNSVKNGKIESLRVFSLKK